MTFATSLQQLIDAGAKEGVFLLAYSVFYYRLG